VINGNTWPGRGGPVNSSIELFTDTTESELEVLFLEIFESPVPILQTGTWNVISNNGFAI